MNISNQEMHPGIDGKKAVKSKVYAEYLKLNQSKQALLQQSSYTLAQIEFENQKKLVKQQERLVQKRQQWLESCDANKLLTEQESGHPDL